MDAVPAALDKLVVETQADLVQIWSVDMQANAQRFIGARRNDGERPVIPNPRRLPVIVTTSDIKALVSVISGTPVCGALGGAPTPDGALGGAPTPDGSSNEGSPLIRRLAGRGMKRACAIPIPTSPEAFVGVIYLGWLNPPEPDSENIAVAAAREVAGTLSTK